MATKQTVKFSSPLHYRGSLVVLALSLFFWPPFLVILGVKNCFFEKEKKLFYCHYRGSWNWVFFWGIVFFTIAYLLLVLKGLDVVEEEITSHIETPI